MQYYGDNGIIKKAQQAKELYENGRIMEEEEMNTLLAEYENMMAEPPYEDSTLPTEPQVTAGMTRVVYNSTTEKWEKAEKTDKWYDYSSDSKQWANVVLGDATFNSDGTLDESKAYTQLVWIPRYAYKITSQYHKATSDAGNINIVFIDTNNYDKAGTTQYTRDTAAEYPSVSDGAMSDYVVHPAFEYGDGTEAGTTHLAGFWMGKFESSRSDATSEVEGSSSTVKIAAGVQSWRSITIGDIFSTCLEMKNNTAYGWTSTAVDPHMCKNDEWGAVAYLCQSIYGKNSEVYINNSSSYITGNSGGSTSASSASGTTYAYNTTNGVGASTTGNITGIYDMSGGAWEYVAAYVNNGNSNLTNNGGSLVSDSTASKYRNVYSIGSSDSQENNYSVSTPANGHYGDAVYETSSSYYTTFSWYGDCSGFPYSDYAFFGRGGFYSQGSYAGVLAFGISFGDDNGSVGFRVVIPVL